MSSSEYSTNSDSTNSDSTNSDSTNSYSTNSYSTNSDSSSNLSSSPDQINNLELQGKILKNYNIITELGRGAYSIVWLGFNISDLNFYAIKVGDPDEYEEGLHELNLLKKIKPNNNLMYLKDYFIEKIDDFKYICSVFELHCCSLHHLLKYKYENGLPFDIVNKIYKQLTKGINYLHKDLKVFHGDIKPDNILVKGISNDVKKIIDQYKQMDFLNQYSNKKKQEWINKGKKLKNINKMKSELKLEIRRKIHEKIINNINLSMDSKEYDDKFINNIEISLADFGSHCSNDEMYEEEFGTEYYNPPEAILLGDCTYKVDIWSLGCTIYELITGEILFDPDENNKFSNTTLNHLYLIDKFCGKLPIDLFKESKYYNNYFKKKKLREIDLIEKEKDFSSTINVSLVESLVSRGLLKIKPHYRYLPTSLEEIDY